MGRSRAFLKISVCKLNQSFRVFSSLCDSTVGIDLEGFLLEKTGLIKVAVFLMFKMAKIGKAFRAMF